MSLRERRWIGCCWLVSLNRLWLRAVNQNGSVRAFNLTTSWALVFNEIGHVIPSIFVAERKDGGNNLEG